MNRVVIPRTQATMGYIGHELEEMAREEVFRIKLIKRKKLRIAEAEKTKNVKKSGCMAPPVKPSRPKPKPDEPEPESESDEDLGSCDENCECESDVEDETPSPKTVPGSKTVSESKTVNQSNLISKLKAVPESDDAPYESPDNKMKILKKLLTGIVTMGKTMVETGGNYKDMDSFLKFSEEAKLMIDNYFDAEEEAGEDIDENQRKLLEHLNKHLSEVVDLTQNLQKDTVNSWYMMHLIETCQTVDENLENFDEIVGTKEKTVGVDKKVDNDAKARLMSLKEQIEDVVKNTEDIKTQGLLTSSVDHFIKSCSSIKSHIDACTKGQSPKNDKEGCHGCKRTCNTKKKENSTDLDNLKHTCNKLKVKLDEYKKNVNFPHNLDDGSKNNLMEQLQRTIDLTTQAKESGIIDKSVDRFVESCENIKKAFKAKKEKGPEKPNALSELRTTIDGVIKLVEAKGLVTKSVEDFLKACETTKNMIDVHGMFPPEPNREAQPNEGEDDSTDIPICSTKCIYEAEKKKESTGNITCDACARSFEEPIGYNEYDMPKPPCDACSKTKKKENLSPYPCASCAEVPPSELVPEVEPEPPEPKKCIFCHEEILEEEEELPPPPSPPAEASNLGYFEENIKKIVKVKRYLNPDGSVREDTETIIIRKNVHDPDKNDVDDDDDFQDLPDVDDKCVAVYVATDPNRGIIRLVKSENVNKTPPIAVPILRQSMSHNISKFTEETFADANLENLPSTQSSSQNKPAN